MGRTKGNRKRKSNPEKLETSILDLKKWMTHQNWSNASQLELRNFLGTGRGVCSRKSQKIGDVIIEIPYDLMITSQIVCRGLPKNQFKIHDVLALFLCLEHDKENSQWEFYLRSLPEIPPDLPWLCPKEDQDFFPIDIRLRSQKLCSLMMESFERLSKFFSLDFEVFKWAYSMVNTRAVYVEPKLEDNILLDEPSMALCPYLDMFNHHYNAGTEAELKKIEGNLFYTLKTLSSYRKFEQIFISYGAHDNLKLLMEYGFFIPGNILDTVRFSYQEILTFLGLSVNDRQFKYIKGKYDLYFGVQGASFNLRAVLFVINYCDIKNYNDFIFSDYPSGFNAIEIKNYQTLLKCKLDEYHQDLVKFLDSKVHLDVMADYLKYRVDFVRDLLIKT